MKKILTAFVLLSIVACHMGNHSKSTVNNPMNNIKDGMTKEQVIKALGKPTSYEDLGIDIEGGDTLNPDTTHLEKWMFGNNEQILFTNNLVSGVDTNVMLSQRRLQHIMDSARMVEGKGSEGIIQNK